MSEQLESGLVTHPRVLTLISRGAQRADIKAVIRQVLLDHELSASWCLRWNRDSDGAYQKCGYIWLSNSKAVRALLQPDSSKISNPIYQEISYHTCYVRLEKEFEVAWSGAANRNEDDAFWKAAPSQSYVVPPRYPGDSKRLFRIGCCQVTLPRQIRNVHVNLLCRSINGKPLQKWITHEILHTEAIKYRTSRATPSWTEVKKYGQINMRKGLFGWLGPEYTRIYPLIKIMGRSLSSDPEENDERFALITYDPSTADVQFAHLAMRRFILCSRSLGLQQEIITKLIST